MEKIYINELDLWIEKNDLKKVVRIIKGKIKYQIEKNDFQGVLKQLANAASNNNSYYMPLINTLMKNINELNYKKQQKIVNYLSNMYFEANNYYEKLRISIFFLLLCEMINSSIIENIVLEFLNSQHVKIRENAYGIIARMNSKSDKINQVLLENCIKYKEEQIILAIIDESCIQVFNDIFNSFIEKNIEDFENNSLEEKLIIENLIIKFYPMSECFIEQIKCIDDIAYIYICKNLKIDLPEEYLIKTYNDTNYLFLLEWYSEMGFVNLSKSLIKKIR